MKAVRDKSAFVRLRADQLAAWASAAAEEKRTLSDWVRVVCDEYVEQACKQAVRILRRKK